MLNNQKEEEHRAPAIFLAGPKVDLPEELALFNSCDLRVGRIVECEIRPDSEKLYFEKIDLGEGTLREIGSGL